MQIHTQTLARTLVCVLIMNAAGRTLAQAPAASAPAAQPRQRISLADRVAQRCRAEVAAQGLVGLSVALADRHGVFQITHVGFEDREQQIAVSDATLYRWASVSKPLTAVVMMQLVRDGRLDLDADVRTLVPEFPDKGKTITARLLATHQSGIPHYKNGKIIPTQRTYAEEHPFQHMILALDKFNQSPLVCEPGEKHSYTTYGYILLGAVVERAGGRPFAELVRERVCVPLGLKTLQPDYQWLTLAHRAVGYRKRKDAEATRSTDTDVSWKLPGGGFISNVHDMAAFGAALLGERLLDAQTRARMWTAQPARDGKPTTYGLGWGVGKFAGRPIYAHSGGQEKTATYLLVMPEAGPNSGGIVCAVMCNTEGAALRALARDLVRAAIEDRGGTMAPDASADGP